MPINKHNPLLVSSTSTLICPVRPIEMEHPIESDSPLQVHQPSPMELSLLASLAGAKADPQSEDRQVFLLTELRLHYLERNLPLQAEAALVEAIAIRCKQRPESDSLLVNIRDLCLFYLSNAATQAEHAISEIDSFTEDPQVQMELRMRVEKGKADILYALGEKSAAFRLLKQLAGKALANGFDYWHCIQTDCHFLVESPGFDLAEAYIWPLFKSISSSSEAYSLILTRLLALYSHHIQLHAHFTIKDSRCIKLRNAINALQHASSVTISRLVAGLMDLYKYFWDGKEWSNAESMLEAALYLLRQQGSYTNNRSKVHLLLAALRRITGAAEKKAETVELMLELWAYEQGQGSHSYLLKCQQILTELMVSKEFATAESAKWREIRENSIKNAALFRSIYKLS